MRIKKQFLSSETNRTGQLCTREIYYDTLINAKEREEMKLKRLTELKNRKKLFEQGRELARQGIDRNLITDKNMLNGYDKEMRIMTEQKELKRQLTK